MADRGVYFVRRFHDGAFLGRIVRPEEARPCLDRLTPLHGDAPPAGEEVLEATRLLVFGHAASDVDAAALLCPFAAEEGGMRPAWMVARLWAVAGAEVAPLLEEIGHVSSERVALHPTLEAVGHVRRSIGRTVVGPDFNEFLLLLGEATHAFWEPRAFVAGVAPGEAWGPNLREGEPSRRWEWTGLGWQLIERWT